MATLVTTVVLAAGVAVPDPTYTSSGRVEGGREERGREERSDGSSINDYRARTFLITSDDVLTCGLLRLVLLDLLCGTVSSDSTE